MTQVLDRPARVLGTRRSFLESVTADGASGGRAMGNGRGMVQEVARAACRISRGVGMGDVGGVLGSAVGSRTRAASARVAGNGFSPSGGACGGEDGGDDVIAEQLAALHKRHIYDTSVLLQKEREILAMANRKGSSMSVSYLASLGKLLQQKSGMVTRLLSLLPVSAAAELGIAAENNPNV